MTKRLATSLAVLAAFTLGGAVAARAEQVSLTLLLVSDLYEMKADAPRGGFSRAAAVARAERAAHPNMLFIHAGDAISPSLFSGFDQGEHVIDLLNMEAPDIFVPGNHEYDFGKDVFMTRMDALKSTLMAANLRDAAGNPVGRFEDGKIYEFGPAKVGVLGLTAEDSAVKSSPGDLAIGETLPALEREAKALREAGADVIVTVSHSSWTVDQAIIASGLTDVLLSGDDHDLHVYYNGKTAFAEPRSDAEQMVAIDLSIDVTVDGDKRKVSWWPAFRVIDTTGIEAPADYAEKVAGLQAELDRELDVTLGTVSTALDSRKASVRSGETAIGNLIADAMRAAVGADIAITNGGGIRGDKEYDAKHALTRKDVLTELPFGNLTVMYEQTGAQVMAALENGVSGAPEASGRFPQISGMTVVYDPAKPKGERIVSVMVGDKPLDPAATYKVATNDFMARGGDGYVNFVGAPVLFSLTDAKLMANDVMAYVRKMGDVAPAIEGRITAK